MKNEISINILSDLAPIFRKDLIKFGYPENEVNSIKNDLKLISYYSSIYRRFIIPVPRKLYKSKQFTCPPKHEESLKRIEIMIKNGDLLTPFLSDRLKHFSNDDVLLKNWNIYHLHLGTKKKSNGFISRTKELLYCYFEEENAYLINIFDHKTFTDQKLIEIVHENWPQVLSKFKIKGITGGNRLDNDDMRVLMYKNCNPSIKMKDGTMYISPSLGVTLGGHSLKDIIQTQNIIHWADNQQKLILELMPEIIERAKRNGHPFSDVIDFHLSISENNYIITDIHSGNGFFINSPFS